MTPEHVMAAVERTMARPFEWGPCDCCSAACDVFADLWGIDPMAPVRGYAGARDAMRLIHGAGGLLALAVDLSGRARLISGHVPGGLAITPADAARPSLLICITPGIWAGKSERGFAILKTAAKGWYA